MCPHVVKGFGTLEMLFFGAKGSTEGVKLQVHNIPAVKKSQDCFGNEFLVCVQKRKSKRKAGKGVFRCYRKNASSIRVHFPASYVSLPECKGQMGG